MSGIGKLGGGGSASVPADFKRIWNANPAGSVGAVSYLTINEIITRIRQLPLGERPSQGIPQLIKLAPGIYPEQIWLPDFVWLEGSSPFSSGISGGSEVQITEAILSVGVGGVRNLSINKGDAANNPEAIFLSRNATSAFTVEDYNFGTIVAGNTLKVEPVGFGIETFTFAGGESTAAAVAAIINATGVKIEALILANRVEIIRKDDPTDQITIKSDGTVNAALGFYTDQDEEFVPSGTELLIGEQLLITGGAPLPSAGLALQDQGGGSFIFDSLSIAGAVYGVVAFPGSSTIIRTVFPFFNTNGILVDDGATLEIEGGSSKNNTTTDIFININGTLKARNFTYKNRFGDGALIPSGSRITFEWNFVGNIATGTFLDGMKPILQDCTIETVAMSRRVAGSDGSTIIDLNKGDSGSAPSTIYTTQGNRPTIAQADGDFIVNVEATLPNDLNLTKGQYLSVDVDQKEGAIPKDLNVIVTAVVN